MASPQLSPGGRLVSAGSDPVTLKLGSSPNQLQYISAEHNGPDRSPLGEPLSVMATFSVTQDHKTLVPWTPGESRPPFSSGECRYINAVLAEVNIRLPTKTDLHFVLTNYTDFIPVTGDNVVVVVIRDERGLWPRYAPQVRCVFKAYGFRPILDPISLNQPQISLSSSLRWLRNSAISSFNQLSSSYFEIVSNLRPCNMAV